MFNSMLRSSEKNLGIHSVKIEHLHKKYTNK